VNIPADIFLAWLASTILVAVGLLVYARLIQKVRMTGGKGSTEGLGAPDVVLGALLTLWFGGIIASGFAQGDIAVEQQDIIHGAILFGFLIVLIVAFLFYRGINPWRLFGFGRIQFPKAFGAAVVFLLAAYPLIGLVAALAQKFMKTEIEPQELVRFFVEAQQEANFSSIVSTIFLGVVLAPVAEEVIFRGYLHGVTKRYAGVFAATVFNSALFAAIHLDHGALPALFVLAVCLTVAYEATGSLLVSISMHALFNLITFILLIMTTPEFS
jgi:membrane protease YdiL (CAAX protease family)